MDIMTQQSAGIFSVYSYTESLAVQIVYVIVNVSY